MHLAYIWIVSHLSAKNYQNRCKFDEVLTKTNLLSFFGTRCIMTEMVGNENIHAQIETAGNEKTGNGSLRDANAMTGVWEEKEEQIAFSLRSLLINGCLRWREARLKCSSH